jgi:hypothetical protein
LDRNSGDAQTRSGRDRDEDNAKIEWLFRNYLKIFREEFPEQRVPQVQVTQVDVSVIGYGVSSILLAMSNAMAAGEERFERCVEVFIS